MSRARIRAGGKSGSTIGGKVKGVGGGGEGVAVVRPDTVLHHVPNTILFSFHT